MSALINLIKERSNVALANDARLIKKLFFGLIILSFAFQPGEFGNVIRFMGPLTTPLNQVREAMEMFNNALEKI